MAYQDAGALSVSYGFGQAFFGSDPELQSLINQAVNGQWANEKFQSAFMNTNWYRARQASVRTWFDLATRDPAEANRKISERFTDFRNQISQLGASVDDGTLWDMAGNSLQFGWSDAETKNFLAGHVNFTAGQMGGTPAAVEMQVKKIAGDYGLTLSGSQVSDYVSGVVTSRYTEDNVRDFMADMAKSKYVGMTPYLDKGMTVRQVASQHVSSYAKLLEVDPDSVDLNDTVLQQALQGTPPAPGALPEMQSVYQFERAVRRDPRWLRTKNARDSMTTSGQSLLRDWGLVG